MYVSLIYMSDFSSDPEQVSAQYRDLGFHVKYLFPQACQGKLAETFILHFGCKTVKSFSASFINNCLLSSTECCPLLEYIKHSDIFENIKP